MYWHTQQHYTLYTITTKFNYYAILEFIYVYQTSIQRYRHVECQIENNPAAMLALTMPPPVMK